MPDWSCHSLTLQFHLIFHPIILKYSSHNHMIPLCGSRAFAQCFYAHWNALSVPSPYYLFNSSFILQLRFYFLLPFTGNFWKEMFIFPYFPFTAQPVQIWLPSYTGKQSLILQSRSSSPVYSLITSFASPYNLRIISVVVWLFYFLDY